MRKTLTVVACLGTLGAAMHLVLTGCELESGECEAEAHTSATFVITAKLLNKDGSPAAGAPGFIRTTKKVCDGTDKAVAPLKTKASATGELYVTHGYNLNDRADRVVIEAGFDDYTPHHFAVETFSFDQIESQGPSIKVSLTVQAL